MPEDFKTILTLVDFSKASMRAADEAALIASKFNSRLCLLCVLSNPKNTDRSTDERLNDLKADLHNRYGVEIDYFTTEGKLCDTVNKCAHDLNADLIVLGVSRDNWFKSLFIDNTIKKIIRSVDSEVLCVYPESNSSRLKKIVLPIGKFIPKRKIRLAYELARRFAANVHLISLNKNGNSLSNEETRILMESYQYFKDITNIPIECRTVQGDNLAQATVRYAKSIGADLILVNTGTESDFTRTVLRRWSGNIVNHSSVPVLSVQAANKKINPKQFRANG